MGTSPRILQNRFGQEPEPRVLIRGKPFYSVHYFSYQENPARCVVEMPYGPCQRCRLRVYSLWMVPTTEWVKLPPEWWKKNICLQCYTTLRQFNNLGPSTPA